MKISRIAVALIFLAFGCKSTDSTGPKIGAEVGTYLLATVNGGGLPAIIFQNPAGRITVNSGSFLLREDHSYLETRNLNLVFTTGGQQSSTSVENGTYSVTGTQITFSIPASGSTAAFSYTGAVQSGVLTYTFDGIAYRYQK